MTTLIEVAKRAGVYKSTASNVLRGGAVVADATRKRVERAMAETGYHPNAIARSLKARASTVIGLLVPDLTNPFYAELAGAVERAANALGYAVLTAHTECSPPIENDAGRALIERRVDGVIIGGISLGSPMPKTLLDRNIPVALVSFGEPEDPRLGIVDQNDHAAMEKIVAYLFDLGHRKLTFVPHDLREHSGERRRLGFESALARRGLKPTGFNQGATAAVAHNDMQAIALMDRLESQGLRVPHDVSVVGYDDVPMARHSRIRLTTVRSDSIEMGRKAVDLIVTAARAGRHVAYREIANNPLIIRSTTTRPKT
jgi:LacI family transcriptional regulator